VGDGEVIGSIATGETGSERKHMVRAGWLVLVLIVGGLLASGRMPLLRSRLKWDGTTYYTAGAAPACLTANRYQKFIGYYTARNDPPMAEMIEQGVCVLLRPGIEVQPVRRVGSWLDTRSLVQVRVVGTKQSMVLEERLGLVVTGSAPRR
jgi:hypothetical protein